MRHRWIRLTPLLALAAGAPALAEDEASPPDTPSCEACVLPEGWQGDLWLSGQMVDGAYPTLIRRHADADDGFTFGLDADLTRFTADGVRWRVDLSELGREAMGVAIERRVFGSSRLGFEWRNLPWNVVAEGRTPFRGSGTLTLPAGFVRGDATGNLTGLAAALRPVTLDFERQRLGVAWRWTPGERWSVHARARHETKQGQDLIGASVLNRAALVPEALDHTTDALDLGFAWTTPALRVSFDHTLSRFEESHARLVWDIPFTTLDPALTQGALAAPPDNEARRWVLRAGWRGVSWLRLDAELGRGELTQNEAFVASTTNPGLIVNQPRASLDGRVATSVEALRLTLLPIPGLAVRADVRSDERDDRTPPGLWQQVIGDTVLGGVAADPRYDLERSRRRLELDYRLGPGARVILRAEHRETDRSNQQVLTTEEDRVALTVRLPAGEFVDAALTLEDGDRLARNAAVVFGAENPLATPAHLAARERTRTVLELGVHPSASFDLEFRFEQVEDEYPDTLVGVTRRDHLGASVDAAWRLGENSSLAAWYARDVERDEQYGSSSFGLPDWRASTTDLARALGVEWRYTSADGGTELTADFGWTDAQGAVSTTTSTGGAFPELAERTMWFGFAAVRDLGDDRSLRFSLRRERLTGSDWMLDGVTPTTIPAVLTLGTPAPHYEATFVGISYRVAL